jgi:hypothetical protein
VRLFVTEAMVLLLRNKCALPPELAAEVSVRLTGRLPDAAEVRH